MAQLCNCGHLHCVYEGSRVQLWGCNCATVCNSGPSMEKAMVWPRPPDVELLPNGSPDLWPAEVPLSPPGVWRPSYLQNAHFAPRVRLGLGGAPRRAPRISIARSGWGIQCCKGCPGFESRPRQKLVPCGGGSMWAPKICAADVPGGKVPTVRILSGAAPFSGGFYQQRHSLR